MSKTAEAERATVLASVNKCPTCQQHFSGDARFCPFDGDPLQVAESYHPEADPLLGKVIEGRYEIESVLGEGGMGSVYAVRHRALDKRFAMKVMRSDLAKQGELAARFIQEARATAAIGHPNIVQITDFGELPTGAPYFVMELLDGTPLSKLIRKGGPLPAALAVKVLLQTASALSAAHAAGVIHRDLKPDNIHITQNGTIKILDFGVAKMAGAGRLTRTGMVFGTPHYMSPEQASGTDVDHRADMYALGIIMYEMFTGKVPFEADSYMGVLTKHMFMVPEPPSRVHESARELGALEDVTLRCLEKRPEERYASMDELIHEVQSIAHFNGDRLEIVRPSSYFAKKKSGRPSEGLADQLELPTREEVRDSMRIAGLPRRTPVAAISLVGVAMVGAIGVVLWARRPPPDPSTTAVLAPAGGSVAPAPTASAPAADPGASRGDAPADPSSARAPALPDPVAALPSAAPAKPRREHAAPRASAPARSPGPSPRTPFGSPEIVNPWAH